MTDTIFAIKVRFIICEMHWRLRRTLPIPLGALARLNRNLITKP
jgi:hypothetical protein